MIDDLKDEKRPKTLINLCMKCDRPIDLGPQIDGKASKCWNCGHDNIGHHGADDR